MQRLHLLFRIFVSDISIIKAESGDVEVRWREEAENIVTEITKYCFNRCQHIYSAAFNWSGFFLILLTCLMPSSRNIIVDTEWTYSLYTAQRLPCLSRTEHFQFLWDIKYIKQVFLIVLEISRESKLTCYFYFYQKNNTAELRIWYKTENFVRPAITSNWLYSHRRGWATYSLDLLKHLWVIVQQRKYIPQLLILS